jgi:hypothetical protein
VLRNISAVALLVVVVAGCGGGGRSQGTEVPGVPRALANAWKGQAAEIAAAASAGDDCRARQLATALRADVVASRQKLPRSLRVPLLSSVKTLAERITCTRTVTTVQTVPGKEPKPGHEHHGHHDHGGHGHGDDHGDDG